MSLEPVSIITHDLEKGKGLVFGYASNDSTTQTDPVFQSPKFTRVHSISPGATTEVFYRLVACPLWLVCLKVVLNLINFSYAFPSALRLSQLKKKLVEAYSREESFWKQKSRADWMHSGDKNSKFFHASIKNMRSKYGLTKLVDDNGIVHKYEASKSDVAATYFQKLLSSFEPSYPFELLDGFVPRVTDEMNDLLVDKVSKEEVKCAGSLSTHQVRWVLMA